MFPLPQLMATNWQNLIKGFFCFSCHIGKTIIYIWSKISSSWIYWFWGWTFTNQWPQYDARILQRLLWDPWLLSHALWAWNTKDWYCKGLCRTFIPMVDVCPRALTFQSYCSGQKQWLKAGSLGKELWIGWYGCLEVGLRPNGRSTPDKCTTLVPVSVSVYSVSTRDI